MKLSLIFHCISTVYIYSNKEIFWYKDHNIIFLKCHQIFDYLLLASVGVDSSYLQEKTYDEEIRIQDYINLYRDHSILYMLGLLFILIIVIL